MAPPKGRAASKPASKSGAWAGVGEWLRGGRGGSATSSRPGGKAASPMSTPAARGALLAIGTVLAGVLLVWLGWVVVPAMIGDSQTLTITKPTGGTITGPGIECGTGGDRCSASLSAGESIELDTRPDSEFVFAGYTGDCAPTGRMAMTESKTCGAKFDRVVTSTQASTFRLTINKPEGGTIVGAGGILCGVNGSTCTADIPTGLPVSLKAEAADGFAWDSFTGDCPSTGEMLMTGPKTCSAVFIKSAAPMNPGPRPAPGPSAPVRRTTPPPAVAAPPAPTPTPAPGPAPAIPQGGGLASGQTGPAPTPLGPDKPVAAPITQEEHAKQEIGRLVKNYCAALDSLNPARVRGLFHLDNERELRTRYREYKSLKCTISSPPEFDRLDASEAGGAQLKFGMKQVLEMKSGGAPGPTEYIVTMVVSRKGFQTPWLIDRVNYEVKPK
jgi:hypothetical protein